MLNTLFLRSQKIACISTRNAIHFCKFSIFFGGTIPILSCLGWFQHLTQFNTNKPRSGQQRGLHTWQS